LPIYVVELNISAETQECVTFLDIKGFDHSFHYFFGATDEIKRRMRKSRQYLGWGRNRRIWMNGAIPNDLICPMKEWIISIFWTKVF